MSLHNLHDECFGLLATGSTGGRLLSDFIFVKMESKRAKGTENNKA